MRTFRIGLVSLVALALSAAATAAPRPGAARAHTHPNSVVSSQQPPAPPAPVAELFNNRSALAAAWSADGKWVVVSANLSGRYNLWKYSVAGGAPVQLTHSDDRQMGLTLSPDGKWVVYQQDHGGDEMYDLYAVPLAGGEPVNLTNSPTVSETGARFSPDGKTLAFAAKAKTSPISNVAVMDMATRKVRQLTDEKTLDNGWGGAVFTPDGKALIANRRDIGSTVGSIWRLSLAGGAPKRLDVPPKGKVRIAAADISKDGKQLSVTSNAKGGLDQAGLLDVATGQIKWLAPSRAGAAGQQLLP